VYYVTNLVKVGGVSVVEVTHARLVGLAAGLVG
jgi:hypothetical protein